MSDRIEQIKDVLAKRARISSHYEGCWKDHCDCMARILLEQLTAAQAIIEKLPKDATGRLLLPHDNEADTIDDRSIFWWINGDGEAYSGFCTGYHVDTNVAEGFDISDCYPTEAEALASPMRLHLAMEVGDA